MSQIKCLGTKLGISVHLFGGPTEPSAVLMGRVLVYKDDQWLSFCPTVFSQPAADIVCGQLGFSSAEIMLPGSFGSSGFVE